MRGGVSKCFELTLLPGVDPGEFEKWMREDTVPGLAAVADRFLGATTNILLKSDTSDAAPRYIWLVFVSLVGSGPELASAHYFSQEMASNAVARFATVTSFSEVASNPSST